MKKELEDVNELKSEQKQLDFLVKSFKEGRLNVDDLVSAKDGLNLRAVVFNNLGVVLGENEGAKNESAVLSIRSLYEIAIAKEKNYLLAKCNLANSLLEDEPKDEQRALKLYHDMFDPNEKLEGLESEICYYNARYHYERHEYSEAWNCLHQAIQDGNIKKTKDDKFHLKAQALLNEIKKLTRDELGELFYKAKEGEKLKEDLPSIEEVADALAEKLNTNEALPETWCSISDGLDIYNESLYEKELYRYKDKKFNYKVAVSSLDLAEAKLKKVQEKQKPLHIVRFYENLVNACKEAVKKAEATKKAFKKIYAGVKDKSEKKQIQRMVTTEKHFFAIERNKNEETKEQAKKILEARQTERNSKIPERLVTGVPTRRLIAAELGVVRASLKVMGGQQGYDAISFPWTKDSQRRCISEKSGREYYMFFGNAEITKCGGTLISSCQKINSHENHVGDFHEEDLGGYDAIMRNLGFLTDDLSADEKMKLAQLMLRYAKSGEVITIQELEALRPNDSSDDCEKNLEFLIRLCYHTFVKEPARWMICEDQSHELPLATVQFRAMKLIEKGFLSFAAVFKKNAKYGVYTGKDIGQHIRELKTKVIEINHLYNEKILFAEGKDTLAEKINMWGEKRVSSTVVPKERK